MTYSELILSHGPSNYWKLNESSGLTAADSAGSAPGTISGGVTLAQAGALADGTTAMSFDGTTGVVTCAALTVGALATHSLEYWVKIAQSAELYGAPFAPRNQTGLGGCWTTIHSHAASNGHARLTYRGLADIDTPTVITYGVWHHVVWTFGAGTATGYVDGAVAVTTPVAYTDPTTGPLVIGFNANGLITPSLPIAVDEVAIYLRVLTPTEISDHYAARLTTAVPSAGCDHTTVWSKHLATLSAPTVETERAYLANLYGEPGGTDMSTLVSRYLQEITCGTLPVTPAAPTLSTVAPNTGTQGTMVTVTLTGTGFIANATGVRVNGVGISVVNIHVLNPTSLTADLAIAADAPPTARSITVSTAGGSSAQAFTVAVPTVTDPNFGSVVLLIGAETALVDESGFHRTLTAVGNAARTTAQAKFGTASIAFDGAGDWVQAADSADFDLGTGDFTAEGWFRFTGAILNQALMGQWGSAGADQSWFLYIENGLLKFITLAYFAYPWTPTLGQWYHLAVDRRGTEYRVYVDGVGWGFSTGLTPPVNSSQPFTLGAIGVTSGFPTYDFTGQMDEIRITKGLARYAGAFTPPTAAFPRS